MPRTPKKVVIVRPGALGDVVVARGLLAFLKTAFPAARIVLIAPGERGRLLVRGGWADTAYDWERSVFARLFSPPGLSRSEELSPSEPLSEAFGDADVILSFTGREDTERGGMIGENLRRLAGRALVWCGEAHPESGERGGVVRRLAETGAEVMVAGGFLRRSEIPDLTECVRRRWRVEADDFPFPFGGRGYLLIHPGSGSGRKNWPLANFADLARGLLTLGKTGSGGETEGGAVSGLAIVSGEADGNLAEDLRSMVGAGEVFRGLSLAGLCALLSRASLYVGNDSGVSHLSCAVQAPSGAFPFSTVLFGPSDAGVWGEEESLCLHGGADFSHLSVPESLASIVHFFRMPFADSELS